MNDFIVPLISILSIALFVLGVPILVVIGLWCIGISLVVDLSLANLGVTLYEGLNFFGLLAMPLFILTGDMINAAGIARKLTNFAHACLGWLRGGFGMATLGACGFFAAISGLQRRNSGHYWSHHAPTDGKGWLRSPIFRRDHCSRRMRRHHHSSQHSFHHLWFSAEPAHQ